MLAGTSPVAFVSGLCDTPPCTFEASLDFNFTFPFQLMRHMENKRVRDVILLHRVTVEDEQPPRSFAAQCELQLGISTRQHSPVALFLSQMSSKRIATIHRCEER